MRRYIEVLCVLLGIIILCFTVYYFQRGANIEEKLKILAFGAGLMFFAYKLLTGWLFINLSVSMTPKRESADDQNDHLALEITLTKGNIDSLWVSSVECRISEYVEKDRMIKLDNPKVIEAIGTKKWEPVGVGTSIKKDYWSGTKSRFYVLSPNETAVFSSYTTVPKARVIVVEIAVIGKRPFYGIEKWRGKSIQWRSSFIVLPSKTNQGETLVRI